MVARKKRGIGDRKYGDHGREDGDGMAGSTEMEWQGRQRWKMVRLGTMECTCRDGGECTCREGGDAKQRR